MPRAACTNCHDHPAALPAQLCTGCTRQVHRDLAAMDGWYAALLHRPRSAPGQRVGGGSTEPSSPADDRALDQRAAIRHGLASWALHLAAAHDIPVPTAAIAARLSEAHRATTAARVAAGRATTTEAKVDALRAVLRLSRHAADLYAQLDHVTGVEQVTALAEHLTTHAPTLLATDAAPQFAAALGRLVDRARAIAAPDRPDTVPIGTCPACGGRVLADPATQDAWCARCHETGDIRWWQRRLPAPDEWLPPGRLRMHLLLAHELVVTDAQLWQWAHRGHIRAAGEGRRATYHVGDALTRAQTYAAGRPGVHTVREPA